MFSDDSSALSSSYIKDIGINSDSSIYNTYPIFICLIYIALVHIWLYFSLPHILEISENKRWSILIKILKWFLTKIYDILNFRFYIRNFFLICQFILISAFYEISTFKNESAYRIISLIFAWFMLLFYTAYVGFIFYLIFSQYQASEQNHNKLEEIFRGIKDFRKSRLYPVVSIIRKAVYNFFLLALKTVSSRIVIGIISSLQLGFVVYYIIIRPYKEIVINIIEISNEIFFLLLVFILNFLYQSDHWNSFNTGLFLTMIVLNFVFTLLTILSKSNW